MTEKTYEDGYEAGFKDGREFDEDSYNAIWELGYDEGRADTLAESREAGYRKAIQQFHLMHHKGSYTFEKCWDEPCKNIRHSV